MIEDGLMVGSQAVGHEIGLDPGLQSKHPDKEVFLLRDSVYAHVILMLALTLGRSSGGLCNIHDTGSMP